MLRIAWCEPVTFVPAAGEAAGPPGIPCDDVEGTITFRDSIGGPAASPAAGTNATNPTASRLPFYLSHRAARMASFIFEQRDE